jgi:ribosomal protein L11 methyltransferase
VIRLAVRCRPELAERVLAELAVLAPAGVEEESGNGWVEFALYGAPGEIPELGEVEAAAGDGLVEIRTEEIPDDWADRWRDYHRPVLVADRVLVRPSWHEAHAGPADAVDVVIDPGNAFGTGAHPTTRMCIEMLVGLAGQGERGELVDLGTGSGVLAIIAAKLGFAPVLAVDRERTALDAAAVNAAANEVEIDLRAVNLRTEAPPPAATVVANLTAPILCEIAGRLPAPPRAMVCSGLLVRETEGVAVAFEAAGLQVAERLSAGDWAALRFARPDP